MKVLLNFFFELRQLREQPRSGWQILGVPNAESVAEHSARTAQIAYVLAILESHPNPEHVAVMALFHDIAECRVGDLHKIAQRYVKVDEHSAVIGMTEKLGKSGNKLLALWEEMEARSTDAAKIAKDADCLEVSLTGKEYMAQGFDAASDWYENSGKILVTKSAKHLWQELRTADPNDWWKGLKKLS
jgi:putative hydrolase of HD superfamily